MSEQNAFVLDLQLTTVCLMITVCMHIMILGLLSHAETAEQISRINLCVVSVDNILRETDNLVMVVLAQFVCDLDCLQNIGV